MDKSKVEKGLVLKVCRNILTKDADLSKDSFFQFFFVGVRRIQTMEIPAAGVLEDMPELLCWP